MNRSIISYHVKAYISAPSLVSPVGDRKSNGSDSCLGLLLLCLLKIELIKISFKNTEVMQGFLFYLVSLVRASDQVWSMVPPE